MLPIIITKVSFFCPPWICEQCSTTTKFSGQVILICSVKGWCSVNLHVFEFKDYHAVLLASLQFIFLVFKWHMSVSVRSEIISTVDPWRFLEHYSIWGLWSLENAWRYNDKRIHTGVLLRWLALEYCKLQKELTVNKEKGWNEVIFNTATPLVDYTTEIIPK